MCLYVILMGQAHQTPHSILATFITCRHAFDSANTLQSPICSLIDQIDLNHEILQLSIQSTLNWKFNRNTEEENYDCDQLRGLSLDQVLIMQLMWSSQIFSLLINTMIITVSPAFEQHNDHHRYFSFWPDQWSSQIFLLLIDTMIITDILVFDQHNDHLGYSCFWSTQWSSHLVLLLISTMIITNCPICIFLLTTHILNFNFPARKESGCLIFVQIKHRYSRAGNMQTRRYNAQILA